MLPAGDAEAAPLKGAKSAAETQAGARLRIWIGVACAVACIIVSFTLLVYVVVDTTSPVEWGTFGLHPLLMSLAYLVLAPLAAITYRVGEDLLGIPHAVAKSIHGLLMTMALVVAALGIADMWIVHDAGAEGAQEKGWPVHMQSLHSWVGMTAFVLFSLNWLGGVALFAISPWLSPSGLASMRKDYVPIHGFGGATAVLFALIAVLMGILSWGYRDDTVTNTEEKVAGFFVLWLLPALGVIYSYSRSGLVVPS